MKRLIFILTGCCLLSHISPAQFSVLGADAFGRGNSLVAVPGSASIYHNPGGIAGDTSGFLSFNYLKAMPVEGFHTTGVQGIFRAGSFNYGFSVDSFGDRYYGENRVALALARKQGRVLMGVRISYAGIHTAGMGSRKILFGEAGMIVSPAPLVSLGLSLMNITAAKSYEEYAFPVALAVGAALHPNEKVNLSGQLDYRAGGCKEVRFGLAYQVREQLGFSAGINPQMRSVHFGTTVLAGRYGFLYGIATHPYAGAAHHATFIYKLRD